MEMLAVYEHINIIIILLIIIVVSIIITSIIKIFDRPM